MTILRTAHKIVEIVESINVSKTKDKAMGEIIDHLIQLRKDAINETRDAIKAAQARAICDIADSLL